MSDDQTRVPPIPHAQTMAGDLTWPVPFPEVRELDQTSTLYPPPSVQQTLALRVARKSLPSVRSRDDTIPAMPLESILLPITESYLTGSHQVTSSGERQWVPDDSHPPSLDHIPHSPDLPANVTLSQAVLRNGVQYAATTADIAVMVNSSPQGDIPHNYTLNPPDAGFVPSTNGKAPTMTNKSQTTSEPTLHGVLLNPTTSPVQRRAQSDPDRRAPQHTLKSGPVSHIQYDNPERKPVWSRTIWSILAKRQWSWMICCVFAMAVMLTLGITLGFLLRVKDFHVAPSTTDSGVQLFAILEDVDPASNKITINWIVGISCPDTSCAYDIFFDQSLLSNSNAGGNNFVPNKPVFTITSNESDFSNSPIFTTDITLLKVADSEQQRTLQAYPFDHYTALLKIFATPNNDTSTLSTISIQDSTGIAVGFDTKLQDSINNGVVGLEISVTRGIEVRLYAVVIVISMWLITLVLLSTMILAVVFGRKMAREVMVIPVATLFAFTQLRGTLPGAPPGFGAIIDFIGVLPCLAILTFCALFQTAVFLFRDPGEDRLKVESGKMA